MRFSVDPWDVEYGASLAIDDVEVSSADVVVDLERAAADWSPVAPDDEQIAARRILFVDGVRRIDARVWIEDGDGAVQPGVCASFAAGAVCCDDRAEVVAVVVERGVFSTAPTATDIDTGFATYPARMAASSDIAGLMLAVHERMTQTEVAIAEAARLDPSVELVVIDGPLRGRQHIDGAVGLVKSHAVAYLPPELHRVVGTLPPRHRTPVFTIGTSFSRHSWYLRLPGPAGSPWSGVVRCECSSALAPAAAIALAKVASAALPHYASEPHKDSRAPQNLYPIAGLERELRRRLGDQALLYRSLRSAAAVGSLDDTLDDTRSISA
jgi:hypothetical protein